MSPLTQWGQIPQGSCVQAHGLCTPTQLLQTTPGRETPLLEADALLSSGPVIFNDDGSARIGVKFYKYVAKFILPILWILKEKKNWCHSLPVPSSQLAPISLSYLSHFQVHCPLLPGLRPVNIELDAHVLQAILSVLQKTAKERGDEKALFLSATPQSPGQ